MLKNISVRATVFSFIIITAAILSVSCVMAILMFSKVSREALDTKERHLVSATYANEMKTATIQVWQFLTDVSATGDRNGFKEAEEHVRSFKDSLAKLKKVDPSSEKQLDVLDKQFDQYYTLGKKMAEVYITDGRASGNIIMEDFDKNGANLSDTLGSINNHYQNSFNGAISDLTENIALSKMKMSGVLLIGLVFLLISSFLIINKIIPSLASLNKAMKEIKEGDGDLRRRIKISTKDEVGAVTNSFNSLMDDIHKIISEIKNAFTTLRATTGQVSASAQQTSAAASETAATVNEIASTIEQVSQNAQEIASLSEETSKEAELGAQGVGRVTKQMEVIASTTEETSLVVRSLTTTLNQVNKIVEIITNIADQTNLLALNAAIEAARAGEQGRGFAVVADEVRKLAEQSANAAKDINVLILKVQVESKKAVEAMSEGNNQVREGTIVVEEVGNRFMVIMRSIEELANQMQGFAAAFQQISAGIHNIASTTEEQTATMEEVSSMSENLSKMAMDINQMVGKFKV